jgi:hypothetical protein
MNVCFWIKLIHTELIFSYHYRVTKKAMDVCLISVQKPVLFFFFLIEIGSCFMLDCDPPMCASWCSAGHRHVLVHLAKD